MKATDIAALRQKCTRGKHSPCAAACPFRFDAKAMLEKLKQGDFSKARAIYERAVLFPRIVAANCPAPCQTACPSSVDIRSLETYCANLDGDERGVRLPPRSKRVAVIDGGLSGLACALRLSEHGWGVELFLSGDKLGGKIWEKLSSQLLDADFAVFDKSRVKIHKNAVFGNPTDFDYVYSPNDDITINGILQGLRDSEAIEKALKLGTQPEFEALENPLEQSGVCAPPSDSDAVVLEAQKCGGCECDSCVKDCIMMQHFGRSPEKLFVDLAGTFGVTKGISKRIAQRQIFSCNMCGVCECPSGIDFEEVFTAGRRAIFESGRMPEAYHQFWLQDMEHAMSNDAYFVSDGSAKYLFFPGCQLGASKPEYVTAAYDLLKKELDGVGLLLACCGAPSYWAGNAKEESRVASQLNETWLKLGQPKVITACPSCDKQLAKLCPEWKRISLYELLAKLPDDPKVENARAAIFNPCAAKNKRKIKESVRKTAESRGFSLGASPKDNCCGNGGHMRAVTPELFCKIADSGAFSSEDDAITYCANCRDIFASRGKRAIHILDAFCDTDMEEAFNRPAPSWGSRRRNRELLKARLTNSPPPKEHIRLVINDALMEKLQDELLTEQEILTTILHCEESGMKLAYEGTNAYIGHMRSGAITVWVEYRPVEGGYELLNAYSHRMVITEGVPDGNK